MIFVRFFSGSNLVQWSKAANMNNNAFVNDSCDGVCAIESGKPANKNGFLPKNDGNRRVNSNEVFSMESTSTIVSSTNSEPKRDNWGNSIEFLMSCIAMSVGLGNVWRFPFTALENGGATFLLPYLVVLFVIGRPLYFLEMVIGQFSSRNSIDVYDLSPIFRGNAWFSANSHSKASQFLYSFWRSWIWSIDCYISVEHILCFDHGINRTLSVWFVSIAIAMDPMQARVDELHRSDGTKNERQCRRH